MMHCVNYARTRVFSDLYYPVQGTVYEFFLTRFFIIAENTGQRKHAFWHILPNDGFILDKNVTKSFLQYPAILQK